MPLALGDVFDDRYVIEACVGEGGMGSVYRAYDRKLDRQVALKVLRAESVEGSEGAARLVREARAAAALNHPNAVAVFDVGEHDGLAFIAMELIAGHSLRSFVGDPAIPMPTRVRWLGDVARALSAAHERGIVHRDIKPENVMVRDDGVVKVLDFGIARKVVRSGDEQARDTITQEGNIIGTPLYMAPEQLRGDPLDTRVDQFAWGVVAYELVTGKKPWNDEGASYRTIAQILSQAVARPSLRAPELAPNVDDVIVRSLHKDRRDRFASMDALLAELDGRATEGPTVDPPRRVPTISPRGTTLELAPTLGAQQSSIRPESAANDARGRSRLRTAAVASAGALAVAGFAFASGRVGTHTEPTEPDESASAASSSPSSQTTPPLASASPSPPVELRRSIAVAGLHDAKGGTRDAWRASAIAELLTAELAAGGRLRAIPSERVARGALELGLPPATALPSEAVARLQDNLGFDLLVTGSILVTEASSAGARKLQLQVILLDAKTGATLASVVDAGQEDDLFSLVARVGRTLRAALGVVEPSSEQRSSVGAALPASSEPARFYAQAITEQHRFHDREALALLVKVTALAPGFALGHARMAQSLSAVGNDEGAQVSAKRALDLSAGLSREERLWIEALHHATFREWDEAARTYQALFTFFPDTIDYGIAHARMLGQGNRPKEELAATDALHKLPSPLSDDPRIDYEESRAAHMISDYPRCLAAALAAIARARAHNNQIVVAHSGYLHGIALINLGRADEGLRVLEDAKALARSLGDIRTVGVIQTPLATAYARRGDLARARRELEEAHADLTTIGNAYYAMSSWEQLGGLDIDQGNIARGRKRREEAIAYYRVTRSQHALGGGLPSLAIVVASGGDVARAKKLAQESGDLARASGRKLVEGGSEIALAFIARLEGDLASARAHDERALEIARGSAHQSGIANALFATGERRRLEGDLVESRRNSEEALSIRVALDERLRVAETRVALARGSLDEGHASDAEALARTALGVLEPAGIAAERAMALAVLARALAAQGRVADAKAALAAALPLAPGDVATHLAVRLAGAQVRASAKESGARADLDAVRSDATRAGFGAIAREAERELQGK